ncbi:MAG TPA: hypothetical protein VG326_13045 [Tepidisphaeraceae bacterium]|nr:hypothetical protein [Tepidisphaeraceae bacterium]
MSDAPLSASPVNDADLSIFGPRKMTQALLIVLIIFSCVVFSYGARFVHWPSEPGVQGSLAQPPSSLGAFLVAIVLLAVCATVGTVALHRRWSMAGLMTATAGLAVWSVRGGTMTYVLFRADDSGAGARVFFELLGELIVFFGAIGAIWNLIWKRHEEPRLGEDPTEPGRSALLAIVAQAVLMAIFVLILVVTPQKKQVMAGVFLAGLFSTAVAEQFFADRTAGRWYWIGPLAAGAFGYIVNSFSVAGMETGDLNGSFAPLARVLPLDYASLGCAGALLGYWWMTPDEEAGDEDEPVIEKTTGE